MTQIPKHSPSLQLDIPPLFIPDRVHKKTSILLWQERGKTRAQLDGSQWDVTEGEVLIIPAGVVHSLSVRKNSVVLAALFPATDMPAVLSVPAVTTVHAQSQSLLLAYQQYQHSILRSSVNPGHKLLEVIASDIAANVRLVNPLSAEALYVAQQIRCNPGDDRTIEDWARAVHVSSRTLGRQFAAETGRTLRQWRCDCRMAEALAQVRSGVPIDVVSRSVGYSSVGAFVRVFKKSWGCNPSGVSAAERHRPQRSRPSAHADHNAA